MRLKPRPHPARVFCNERVLRSWRSTLGGLVVALLAWLVYQYVDVEGTDYEAVKFAVVSGLALYGLSLIVKKETPRLK